MAVQAQYPSHVVLLNRNSQPNHHDYSLDLEPHHPILFNGGAESNNNQRKRPREPMNQLQPQIINISQFSNHNVSTGLRLSFLHEQHNHNDFNHHRFQSEDFATQIKRQRDEIDRFLQQQCEQLQRTLAEKRQKHYRALVSAVEESICKRLREKDSEIEKATRRYADLEARAAQLSVEAQVWQAKARAQEAAAASLQDQLQQAIMVGSGAGGVATGSRRGDDGLGCSSGGGVEGQAEDAESAYVDPERVTMAEGPCCKGCRKKTGTVVVLPCRHLCLCRECDQMAQACPVCLQIRNSSVEVFFH